MRVKTKPHARTSPADNDQGTAPRADLEHVVEEAVALIAPQKDLRRVSIERGYKPTP